MTSSKRKARRRPASEPQPRGETTPPGAGSPRRLRWLLACCGLLLALTAIVYLQRSSTTELLATARECVQSDPQRAEEALLRILVRAEPPPAEAIFLLIEAQARQQRWTEALGALDKLPSDLTDAAPLLAIAAAAKQAGQSLLCDQALERAARIRGPLEETALRALLEARTTHEHCLTCGPQAERLLELAPHDALALRTLGRIRERQGNLPLAVQTFQDLVAARPDDDAARTDYARLLLQVGDLAAADAQLQTLASRSPVAPLTRQFQAELLRLRGQAVQALPIVDELLSRAPRDLAALRLRGFLRLDLGDVQGAIDDLSAVVQADPGNEEACYKLGQALLRAGQTEAGRARIARSQELIALRLEAYDKLAELAGRPADTVLRARLVEIFTELGQEDLAASLRGP